MLEEKNVWDLVLSKIDIVDIISEHISLTKQGKNFKACCPFHGEKTPSFVVSPEKQFFKCFGCGKSGNVLKFVEYYKKITSLEALKELAKKANIEIEDHFKNWHDNSLSSEAEDLIKLNKDASVFFQYEMLVTKNTDLESFLEKRKLTKDLIKEFEIGYASSEKSFYKYAIEKDHKIFTIANSSLIAAKNERNFFNNRLIFPIKDEHGNTVAFSGRAISDSDNPKYLNSSETKLFKKHKVLFNYYHAKDEILKTNEVYLLEGQFDCIALYKIEIKNSVAVMGTSLSYDQIKFFKNCKIILFFDNDAAGIKATVKNLKIILYYAKDLNITPYFIDNELKKDADEIYNLDEGKSLKELCAKKIDLLAYLYNEFEKNNKNQSIDENERFKKNCELFEIMFYLNDQFKLTLKNRLIEKKIFASEIYRNYELNFIKPNFPSDPNFVSNLTQESKKKIAGFSRHATKLNNDFVMPDEVINNFDVFEYQIANSNRKIINSNVRSHNSKAKNSSLMFGRSLSFALIIKAILQQPNFLKNWDKSVFVRLKVDENNQSNKELICYVINIIKSNNYLNENNLIELIKNDSNLNEDKKNKFIQIIMNLKTINNEFSQEKFDTQVNNLVQNNKTYKKIIH
ncbi:DNA primase [Mycoplasma phocoeninasale]|uniref:DNA primase n=1 Tax=Mycoplasma phocoeninasale TaxID=2726117 RepID=A0A858U3S3_9MOLU|nr:DNA primase [Mycoplasma phocoeninasale]QJG66651.1 DNA primase [Mycoplasma phocoeninasale]